MYGAKPLNSASNTLLKLRLLYRSVAERVGSANASFHVHSVILTRFAEDTKSFRHG